MHEKLKNPYYGTTNLHKRAETWVWVVTDVQNFALRALRAGAPPWCRFVCCWLDPHPHRGMRFTCNRPKGGFKSSRNDGYRRLEQRLEGNV